LTPNAAKPSKSQAVPLSHEFAIEMRNVAYHLENGRPLISDLSLSITPGETLVLLGRSGSGKTTSLKLVNRLLEPTEGAIFIEGRNQSEWDPIRLRRSIGYVIQDVGLFPHWTVERNVALVPRLERWPEARVRDRVREMLTLVGLDFSEFAGRHARELSGGQRQRVGVARALAGDPPILLMDEPFGALDPITRAELQREFRSLSARLGKTIAFVTHDLREALLLGNRIALLAAGKLLGVYQPDEFLRTPEPEARAFVESLDPAPDGSSPLSPAVSRALSSDKSPTASPATSSTASLDAPQPTPPAAPKRGGAS
jgi:osmoprotectant transport system ATP-binding protein